MDTSDPILPGEVTAAPDAACDAGLRFIGRIKTPFATRADCPRQGDPDTGPEARLHIDAAYAPALQGLAGGNRLDVLYWLHLGRRDLLVQAGKGAPLGTFALRSPLRPNPIGSSVVRLLAVDGPVLTVRGMDCVDGTPLLDIKPRRCPHGGG